MWAPPSKSSSRKFSSFAPPQAQSDPVTRYPETCGKTIEEVEELFSDNGPKPWHTKPGHSKLDSLIEQAREKNLHVKDIVETSHTENVDSTMAGQTVEKPVAGSEVV